MKDLRDLKDLTIHDVKPISDESRLELTGRDGVVVQDVFCFFFFITLEPRVGVIQKSMSLIYEPSSVQDVRYNGFDRGDNSVDWTLMTKQMNESKVKPCSSLRIHLRPASFCP